MLLTLLALLAAIQADRWVHIGGSADAYADYLDRASIKRSGDKVTLFTRRDFVGGQGTAWNELEYDCRARTETHVAWIRDDRGTVSHNVDRPHRAAAPVAPGSMAERLLEIACR